jgi:RES domain-containing protein
VTLPPRWEKDALTLVGQASALEGEFFRSVELAYGHPDDVISGEGTRLYGGRFAKPGLRAVYGSLNEETAFRESAARIGRLAGRGGGRLVAYPRITYVIRVKLATHVDLTVASTSRALLTACSDPHDFTASQEVGEFLRRHGAQGIVFPSAIPGFTGQNLVVFRDITPQPDVLLVNRDEILRQLRHLAERLADDSLSPGS